ncbi:uncharacterized protein LOC121422011 [Lytechinus variegatus]|uniref:uncharacterized protein LOC121422011 n=1 Tax=Lytechinus variegatus TaxID=7654 RepID=UPI001BB104F2|nr:uncharacterized protein LOC121422011 [Lytechinus variegatus]
MEECREVNCPSSRILAVKTKLLESNERFIIICCYLPCGVSTSDQTDYHVCISLLSQLLENSKGCSPIIAGDLNVDMIHPNTKKTLCILKDFLLEEHLCRLTSIHFTSSDFTFRSDDGRHMSCIDSFLVPSRDKHLFINVRTLRDDPTNTSDHLLVSADRSYDVALSTSTASASQSDTKITLKRLKVKWQSISQDYIRTSYTIPMERDAAKLFRSIRVMNDIHPQDAENLLLSLAESMISHSMELPHSFPSGERKGKPEWNVAVNTAYNIAKEARKSWLLSCQDDKVCTRNDHMAAKKSFRRSLRQSRAQLRNDLISEIESASSSNSKLFYHIVKRNRDSETSQTGVSKLSLDGHTYEGEDMLLGWQLYFASLSSTNMTDTLPDESISNVSEGCSTYIDPFCNYGTDGESSGSIHLTSVDIDEAIKLLKSGKAAGIDNISAEHIQNLGDTARRLLLALFNSFLLHAYCPKAFQEGLILPLHKGKGKDPHDPRNYRGITLTSVLCKLLELCLKPHIERQLFTSNIPDELQFGFRKGFSCQLTSLSLELVIELNTAQKRPTYLALLDAEKAFDTVWHRGLFYKLRSSKLSPCIRDMLSSMYNGLESKVFWKGQASKLIPVTQGVRQGGVLSPTLYTTYVDGLIKKLREKNLGCTIYGRFSGLVVLADDIALITTSSTELQQMLEVAFNYAQQWHYRFNPSKCAVVVTNKLKQPTKSSWEVGGSFIEERDNHPHLGVIKSGTRYDPTDNIIGMGLRTFYALSGTGAYTGGLIPTIISQLWKTFCIPRMLQGSTVFKFTKTMLQKLDKTQSHLFKEILGVPKSAADEIVFLLTNLMPVSSQIDLDRLLLLGQLTALGQSRFEYRTFLAALNAGTPIIRVLQTLLKKYDLPDLHSLISNPPSYPVWKRMSKYKVLHALHSIWNTGISKEVEGSAKRERD